MKSFTVIAITAALASAASAFKHEKPGIPELTRPGVEVETRPPVIVVETVTLTKSWAPKETGSGSWKSHKYGGKGYHHDDKDEDEEDEGDDDEKDDDDKKGGWDKDDDDDKKEWKGIHANSFAPKASFGAAQVSSLVNSMTSAAASRATSVASRASSAAASASASVTATHASGGNNLRVGGALVAGAAGFAAYLLL